MAMTTTGVGIEGGINPYLYADNNPLRYIDRFGLWGGPPSKGAYYPRGPAPSKPAVSTNDPGPDDVGLGIAGILCAVGVTSACGDPDLFVCTRWRCTPKCGEPYYKENPATEVSWTDPNTPCVCVRKAINRNFDKPLPGL